MEKILNVENDWDGEVDGHEVMGLSCLISEEEVAVSAPYDTAYKRWSGHKLLCKSCRTFPYRF